MRAARRVAASGKRWPRRARSRPAMAPAPSAYGPPRWAASYNFGGAAAGIDYRLDPRFLVGIGAGYTAGNLWVNNFLGKGNTDSVAVAAYGSFTQGGLYADALAGYAYFYNQLQRQIIIPGLQPRTANGAAGANQALGQVETGYTLGVFAPAAATVTPFARLQGS